MVWVITDRYLWFSLYRLKHHTITSHMNVTVSRLSMATGIDSLWLYSQLSLSSYVKYPLFLLLSCLSAKAPQMSLVAEVWICVASLCHVAGVCVLPVIPLLSEHTDALCLSQAQMRINVSQMFGQEISMGSVPRQVCVLTTVWSGTNASHTAPYHRQTSQDP